VVVGEDTWMVEPGEWAAFRSDTEDPVVEVLAASGSVAYVEARDPDGSLRLTIYGPEGEPAFTTSRIPLASLKPCRRPPWGVTTGTIRRAVTAESEPARESKRRSG
jgi:hypothetical protein